MQKKEPCALCGKEVVIVESQYIDREGMSAPCEEVIEGTRFYPFFPDLGGSKRCVVCSKCFSYTGKKYHISQEEDFKKKLETIETRLQALVPLKVSYLRDRISSEENNLESTKQSIALLKSDLLNLFEKIINVARLIPEAELEIKELRNKLDQLNP